MKHSMIARIRGTGVFLPPKVLSNCDFEEIVDTSDEWIVSRTGIRERRIADEGVFPSTMGEAAARMAIENTAIDPAEIDLVIVATMSGDYPSPSTAALIQAALGLKAGAMDLQAACSGFVYVLATAKAYVEAGLARAVLVVAAEKMSALLDYSDRKTCVLFGDGASAAIVTSSGAGLAMGRSQLCCDGKGAPLVMVKGGGTRHPPTAEMIASKLHLFQMNGQELYKQVIRRVVQSILDLLRDEQLSPNDLRWLVPHQANQRLMESIAKHLEFPLERVYSVVAKYGNTSAAGAGIALHELMEASPLQEGERLLLSAFGGGLTWASLLLTRIEG